MEKKFWYKVITFIVIVALISSTAPLAFAAPQQASKPVDQTELAKQNKIKELAQRANSSDSNIAMNNYNYDSANIVSELVNKRDEYSRQFKKDDGTYEAVLYSTPVNFKKADGTWAPVDNTLIQDKDNTGSAVFKTKDNGYMDVSFAGDKNSNKLVSITKDKYTFGWQISGNKASAVTPQVVDDVTPVKKSLNANGQKRLAETASSHIKYSGIMDGVDIDYIVQAESVKENITLNSYIPNYSISFGIDAKGLTPKNIEGGITAFCDGTTEEFYLLPSHMTDNNDSDSCAIKTELTPTDNGYKLTLTPDDTWLKSAAYPVVIDPQVSIGWDRSNIQDTYVSSKYPKGVDADGTNGPWYTYGDLRMGYETPDYDTLYDLVKFTSLPVLNTATIISATMMSERDDTYSGNHQFTLHKITSSWSQTGVTWNNKPSFDSTNIESQMIGDSYVTNHTFLGWDITSLVQDWYTGVSPNYGMLIKGESPVGYKRLFSANASYYQDATYTVICYMNDAGMEDYGSYKTMSAKRAGDANVNLFTGNLVTVHNDISTSGAVMPVSISHVHNTTVKDNASVGYGLGWQLNYEQTISGPTTINGVSYYLYTDDDGTIHYIKQVSGVWTDEADNGRTMSIDTGSTTARYSIIDESNYSWIFDSSGRLDKLVDDAGNHIDIVYSGTTNKITQITDGSGRVYTLAYNGSGGNLSSISAPGSRTVTYGYDSSYRLTSITDPDNNSSTFGYDTNNDLTMLKNFDNCEVDIGYTTGTYWKAKVSSLSYKSGTTLGTSLTFSYDVKTTTVTDITTANQTSLTYLFDQYGDMLSTTDNFGRAVFQQYYNPSATVPNSSPAKTYGEHVLACTSKIQEPVMNILKNNSFETSGSWTSATTNGGTESFATDQKEVGGYSAKLTNPSTSSTNTLSQAVTWVIGATYTLTGWVKTSGASGTGAVLSYSYYDSTNTLQTKNTPVALTGDNDWTRLDVSFAIPSNAYSTTGQAILSFSGTSGTAWFDGIELEKAAAVDRYNLVQNGDMTYSTSGTPDFWAKGTGCTSSDTDTTTTAACSDLDANAFEFVGSTSASKTLSQTVMVSGALGDSFTFGAWAYTPANALPSNTVSPKLGSYSRQFAIEVDLKNGSTAAGSVTIPYNDYTNSWQYLTGSVTATGTYDRAVVTLIYKNEMNTAYFDGAELYKESIGESDAYDASSGSSTSPSQITDNTTSLNGYASYIQKAYTSNNQLSSETAAKSSASDPSNTTSYTYGTSTLSHRVINDTSPTGVKSVTGYATNGIQTSSKTVDPNDSTNYIETDTAYTTDGNYIAASYDERHKETDYGYDAIGDMISATDPIGQVTTYTYDSNNMGKLTGVSTTVNGTQYSNTYGYTNDNLTTLTTNNYSYNIGYNLFGQETTVSVGTQNLVTNNYSSDGRSLLNSTAFGNGGSVNYSYNDRQQISAIGYDGDGTNPRYSFFYATNGQASRIVDTQNNLTSSTIFDKADNPMRTTEYYTSNNTIRRILNYSYNNNNLLSQFGEIISGTNYNTVINYNGDNEILNLNYTNNPAGSENVRYNYDTLGRINTRTLETGNNDFVTSLSYMPGNGTNGTTTNLVQVMNNNGSTLTYDYTDNELIKSVASSAGTIHYYYDGLSQLTRVDDPMDTRGGSNGSTWSFAYDAGGNITSKTLYADAYNDNDLSDNTVVNLYPYVYDTTWKDKLTSYNGTSISYDSIGNPNSDGTWSYTWEAGRQLQQMTNGTTTLQFKYNQDGLRTQKINGSTTTTYYWDTDYNLTHMTSGSDTLHFYYDGGQAAMVSYDGTNYYYVDDLQGDVISLIDMSGNSVVNYTYDSWGKQLSCTGSLASTLGLANPLRFRGYIFDNESGLYYLQSRYYNPEWGRFINSDDLSIILYCNGHPLSSNAFMYCLNNPLMNSDPNGQGFFNSRWFISGVINLAISLIMGLAGSIKAFIVAEIDRLGTALAVRGFRMALYRVLVRRLAQEAACTIAARIAGVILVIMNFLNIGAWIFDHLMDARDKIPNDGYWEP